MTGQHLVKHIRKTMRDQQSSVDYGLFYADDNNEALLCLFATAAQDVVLNMLIRKEMFHTLEHLVRVTPALNQFDDQTVSAAMPDYVHIIGGLVLTRNGEETASIHLGVDASSLWHIGHTFVGIIGDRIWIGDGFRNNFWNREKDSSGTVEPLRCKVIYISRPQPIAYNNTEMKDFAEEVYFHIADIAVSMLMAKQMRNTTGLKRKAQASSHLLIANEVAVNARRLQRGVQ